MIATYRSFQLPWELSQDQDAAYRKLVKQFALAVLAFCIVMPLLPVPEPDPSVVEELPPRFEITQLKDKENTGLEGM